ncbi:MAG TPA: group 1 truncated hemoglobin [Pyrinomonadaceae bacterium]|nr:group 1 truncated hemoglobin [Pyrinomonadaceae bacterium]
MGKCKALLIALLLFSVSALSAEAQGSMNANSSSASASTAQQRTLFERLGGLPAITAFVDDAAARLAADTRINKKLANTNIPRLRLHLIEQLCMVTGGPCEYTGQTMKKTHQHMQVTEGEWNATVEDLVATMNHLNIGQQEQTDMLNILGSLKSQIVEVNSSATGTPLPSNFHPAPALPQSQIDAGPKMKKTRHGH